MMAPLPNPTPPPDRPELPRVRLEVRAGSGRTVTYEVGGDEFLIGGAAGCDLRLPGLDAAPVVCQITRKPDGVRVRRFAPGLPVLLNGTPLPSNTPTPFADGDRLTVSGVEITAAVRSVTILSPKLIPLDAAPPVEARTPPAPPAADPREADLARRQRELDAQTEELEADRVLWYRRRQEMEQELARANQELSGQRAADLVAREQEVARVGAELAALREQIVREYHERRDETARAGAEAEAAAAKLQEERAAFAAERAAWEARRAEFDTTADVRRQQAETEVADRLRQADDEIARRRAAFEAEVAAHEPQRAELRDHQARLASTLQDLTRQRDVFADDLERFTAARDAFESERAVDLDRLGTWEQTLSEREADLAAREEAVRTGRAAVDDDRRQLNDDLLRLDRRRAELEDRERAFAARSAEAEVRFEQLRRDADEWEETMRLAAAEQERQRAEADRLDRQRADLDAQTAKLSERAAQLEAQQGVLAVLRSKLDRTREEVGREATALAAARIREDEAQAELRDRIREAEQLRAELSTVQESATQELRRLGERDSLLSAGLDEIRQQKDALAAEDARLQQREAELDARSAEFAEQAGALKGRMAQALDLQARLEADRVALREREAALAQAEEARQALQEQLRRRADELTARSKALDDLARQHAADRAALDQARASTDAGRAATAEQFTALQQALEARAAEVEHQARLAAEREAAFARQSARLREVGQAVAAERKTLAATRAKWEADLAAAEEEIRAARADLAAFRERAVSEAAALRADIPEMEEQGKAALDRIVAAKDVLRGHLGELNDFARQSRADLEAVRAQVRAEADRLRGQEAELDRARGEHRLAVTEFRQQLVEWQGKVAEIKAALTRGESRLDARQAAAEEAARQADAATRQLAEQAELLRRERAEVGHRRTEVERHLADMREWYRKKLRELAGSGGAAREHEPPSVLKLHDATPAAHDDLEPGDRQLGELLRSLELVDGETLAALWAEAGRQRRTLRQVLLASGAVTLYQLALIEAGNLDGLMLGRFRVIDKLRATSRETMYRVHDAAHPDGKSAGVFLLRHLAEAEMQSAVRPDEFRQRFAAARDAAHPNLAGVVEVADVNGRPAVLQEWLTGLFSADWPAPAAHPGCWVRLMTMAVAGIDAAHRAGLTHGRLTSDSFVLTAAGVLKVTGFGEPAWLAGGPASPVEPSAAADLRALGQVAFGWSQLAAKKRVGGRAAKPFPAELAAVVRRLEADPEPPMADTVAADHPYASAADLLTDLKRVARETSFSDDAWEKLLRHVADNAPDSPVTLRQSA